MKNNLWSELKEFKDTAIVLCAVFAGLVAAILFLTSVILLLP